jgi:hypothetical protein
MFTTIFPKVKDMPTYDTPMGIDAHDTSSFGPINLIVAVRDHAPVRIEELEAEETSLLARLDSIRTERATLGRLVDALEMPF